MMRLCSVELCEGLAYLPWTLYQTMTLTAKSLSPTASRVLAQFLLDRRHFDPAAQVIESVEQRIWDYRDFSLALQCALARCPQSSDVAEKLLALSVTHSRLSTADRSHFRLLFDTYIQQDQFFSQLERYEHSRSSFVSKHGKWGWSPTQRIRDLDNAMIQVCVHGEQYEVAWEIYERMKDWDVQTFKIMMQICVAAFRRGLCLKRAVAGQESREEEEIIKWEGRSWYAFLGGIR
jgi:pentatricopeptide repeat protein